MSENIPTKTVTGRINLPYMTRDIKRLINKKKRVYNRAKRYNRRKDWALFRNLRKCVHSQLNKAYRNYINCLLDPEQNKNNKKFWRYVKSKRQDNFGVSTLKGNGKVATDQKAKAEMLDNQFSSVFTKENTSNLPDKGRSTFPAMPDINITPTGVSKLLSNLKVETATIKADLLHSSFIILFSNLKL